MNMLPSRPEPAVDRRRVRTLNDRPLASGPVVYWMNRDLRVEDNYALIFAQELALEFKRPLGVIVCPDKLGFGNGSRQFQFMIGGLREVADRLESLGISFSLVDGRAEDEIPALVDRNRIGFVTTDFSPLRQPLASVQEIARRVSIPVYQVDAHNIVPCWVASNKQEFAARTLRPKLMRLLPDFLTGFPKVRRHPFQWSFEQKLVDWGRVMQRLTGKSQAGMPSEITPGAKAAKRVLRSFIERKSKVYATLRNDPTEDAQSGLSCYLNAGNIAPQRVAIEAISGIEDAAARDAFLEELVVRRELSDNYCFYNQSYDSADGFPEWAKRSLAEHLSDERPYRYTPEQFENAETHDVLWNAAQVQMVETGKMHGYMRMYWAKKILEWTSSPEDALAIAIYLNDKYELDGCDPNGYAGIAWSIGGLHDRPWAERHVFGKVRYMSSGGCKRKFDVNSYVERFIKR